MKILSLLISMSFLGCGCHKKKDDEPKQEKFAVLYTGMVCSSPTKEAKFGYFKADCINYNTKQTVANKGDFLMLQSSPYEYTLKAGKPSPNEQTSVYATMQQLTINSIYESDSKVTLEFVNGQEKSTEIISCEKKQWAGGLNEKLNCQNQEDWEYIKQNLLRLL